MTDDRKPEEKPDPIEDVRKGLGLLFRAAKSAVESLPKGKFEEVVLSGAREVGRAIENVTQTIDKQIFKKEGQAQAGPTKGAGPEGEAKEEPKDGEPASTEQAKKPDEPKGPRVG